MMTDFQQIYATQAARYDALVSREDYQGNLLSALNRIRDFAGLRVVDVGAGTGRVTRLLAPYAAWITAVDLSPHMLRQAKIKLVEDGATNCFLTAADARHLPFCPGIADVVMAGWALGHSVGWYPESWQAEIGQAIHAMQNSLRPDGALILIETMGTGVTTAGPPTPGLAAYYAWLQNDLGFQHTTIPTDYRFHSVSEAVALTQFFFGSALAAAIQQQQLTILPEFTGIWWKENDSQ